jgi:hypothetical protein
LTAKSSARWTAKPTEKTTTSVKLKMTPMQTVKRMVVLMVTRMRTQSLMSRDSTIVTRSVRMTPSWTQTRTMKSKLTPNERRSVKQIRS